MPAHYPITIPLHASTQPRHPRSCQHTTSSSPCMAPHNLITILARASTQPHHHPRACQHTTSSPSPCPLNPFPLLPAPLAANWLLAPLHTHTSFLTPPPPVPPPFTPCPPHTHLPLQGRQVLAEAHGAHTHGRRR